jgi:RNA polymerase-binding transcription factor DksA
MRSGMPRPVNDPARRRLRARFWQVLARYRSTQGLIDEELDSREIEEVENATELWDSSVLSRLSDVDLVILSDVLAALRRVASGTYGRCVSCDEVIPAARLEVLPEAARCVDCAVHVERPRRQTG